MVLYAVPRRSHCELTGSVDLARCQRRQARASIHPPPTHAPDGFKAEEILAPISGCSVPVRGQSDDHPVPQI